MQVSFTAAEIAALIQPKTVRGSTAAVIHGIAGLSDAGAGDLSFLGNAKYKVEVAASKASIVLLPLDFAGEPQPDQQYLLVENPSAALSKLCSRIEQSLWPRPTAGVHPSASVDPTARVAASATVGPQCVIEAGAVIGERVHLQAQVFVGRATTIGDDSWLMPGTVVAAESVLGRRVRLQPGVIIGSDGFGYEFAEGRHVKVPQVGQVVVEDDVEMGANTTVDRARFSRTVIGAGTKIDNLVQIAHNVIVGRHCLICAQVGVSGSVTIEDYVVLGGQVGVAGHITIAKGTKVGAQSGVAADTEAGSFLNGTPAINYQLERRLVVLQRRLPDLFKRVDALTAQLRDAEKSSSG
ncbi:UDP-3-O-(3-hydroxymyristoyl)glucosamine N-acyltransferase [Opitutus sp. ER46]|uniref:UDP-3-O-(3-hydroxymyristoyl)glucosamine N-acyltransferase n=1 Tax=Opitutus sp. ER46 TaxID=2161864 RepID=UPI000D320624|nr:UDP-3-O-(3-hydroxymyristoyl)glucosamine N-acyltransferase [Opitutus sp. ER46]PTX96491.1 UDP-3-O-(3-hydroxymyristoyl)glucosamine N-acyltransferase [Opitutus sp. ER46]